MLDEVKNELISAFGNRVAFNDIERMLYSTDMGSLPPVVLDQIETMPAAVVQPVNSAEIEALIKLSAQNKIPLVPRASATAGYGGAVPTRGGIVVDFSRMKKVIEINKEKKTTTVEPGIIFNVLETALREQGLALRLYPGSAPSASLGGWIANGGGVGIGSFEYGFARDNIVSIDIISPSGKRTLTGNDIDLVYGLAGTTGFITSITLLVRDADEDVPVLAAFPSVEALQGAFAAVMAAGLPLWEVGYKDPQHVKLTEQAIEKQSKKFGLDHHEKEGVPLPEGKYLGSFVFPKAREGAVKAKLAALIKEKGGEVLSDAQAKFDWDERFYPMRLKAAGPSLLPSEVMIPTDKLPALGNEIKKKVKGLAFMGTLVAKGKETSVLSYSLDDERRLGFTFANAQSFIPINTASSWAGGPTPSVCL